MPLEKENDKEMGLKTKKKKKGQKKKKRKERTIKKKIDL